MATVWIDIDNAPHVLFVAPIARELKQRGHRVLVTVRDFGYTRDLADQHGLDYRVIGSHWGGNKLLKVGALATRVAALTLWGSGRGIDVAFSHGCRGQAIAASTLRIPSVSMFDYEYVSTSIFNRFPTKLLLPERLPEARLKELGFWGDRIVRYPGLKEQLYLGELNPDSTLRDKMEIGSEQIVAVLRPPATSAHYHDALSESIFEAVLKLIERTPNAVGIVAPRTAEQGSEVAKLLANPLKFRILTRPVDGLSLIWSADLVVGGGGTMNREAALLGVPVYSTFTGEPGAIDQSLAEEGRLVLIRTPDEVTRILVTRRDSPETGPGTELRGKSDQLLSFIVDEILKTVPSDQAA